MLLRALGLYCDPSTGSNPAGSYGPASSSQLATFVPSPLIVGDGSDAAEIAAGHCMDTLETRLNEVARIAVRLEQSCRSFLFPFISTIDSLADRRDTKGGIGAVFPISTPTKSQSARVGGR
jgi:hypothetical protein